MDHASATNFYALEPEFQRHSLPIPRLLPKDKIMADDLEVIIDSRLCSCAVKTNNPKGSIGEPFQGF